MADRAKRATAMIVLKSDMPCLYLQEVTSSRSSRRKKEIGRNERAKNNREKKSKTISSEGKEQFLWAFTCLLVSQTRVFTASGQRRVNGDETRWRSQVFDAIDDGMGFY